MIVDSRSQSRHQADEHCQEQCQEHGQQTDGPNATSDAIALRACAPSNSSGAFRVSSCSRKLAARGATAPRSVRRRSSSSSTRRRQRLPALVAAAVAEIACAVSMRRRARCRWVACGRATIRQGVCARGIAMIVRCLATVDHRIRNRLEMRVRATDVGGTIALVGCAQLSSAPPTSTSATNAADGSHDAAGVWLLPRAGK